MSSPSTSRLHLYRRDETGRRIRWAFIVDRHQTIVDEYEDPLPVATVPESGPDGARPQAILYRIHAAPSPEAEQLVDEFQDRLARMLKDEHCRDGGGPCSRNALVRHYAEKLKPLLDG